VGLPPHETKKAVFFGYRKPVFRIIFIRWAAFYPFGVFFVAFLAARDNDISPGQRHSQPNQEKNQL
jgi:hypothetical protein